MPSFHSIVTREHETLESVVSSRRSRLLFPEVEPVLLEGVESTDQPPPPHPQPPHQPPPPHPPDEALVVTLKVNVLEPIVREAVSVALLDEEEVKRTCTVFPDDIVPAVDTNHPPLIAYCPPTMETATGTSIQDIVTTLEDIAVLVSTLVCEVKLTVFGILSYRSTKTVIPVATVLLDASNPVILNV